MNDVDRLILEAWEKLGPGIMGDSDELAKRLGRRRRPVLMRPPRAWCLTLRASDTRITQAHWVISPEHALDLDHPGHPYEPIAHEVIIRPHALRKYCRPLRTNSYGEEVADVAKALGTSAGMISAARWAGKFRERYVRGLGGRRGKEIPLIHSWTALDPGGTGHFTKPDPLWGALWEFLADMIPDDFEQTVVRRPKFGTWGVGGRRKVGRGEGAKGSSSMTGRSACPTDHVFEDDVRLIGWRWVCPGCGKEVRKIYYPLKPRTLFDYLGYDPGKIVNASGTGRPEWRGFEKGFEPYDVNQVEAPPPMFACGACHRVEWFTRTNATAWNQVVSHLTRGMLYGREVAAPDWYERERKRARCRKLGRVAVKREGVLRRMSNGWTIAQIAREMLISTLSVRKTMQNILRQEGVKNRRELAAKLGWRAEQPPNEHEKLLARAAEREELVLGMIVERMSFKEIARRMGMKMGTLEHMASRIYRKKGVGREEGRRGLVKKVGGLWGGGFNTRRQRQEVHEESIVLAGDSAI